MTRFFTDQFDDSPCDSWNLSAISDAVIPSQFSVMNFIFPFWFKKYCMCYCCYYCCVLSECVLLMYVMNVFPHRTGLEPAVWCVEYRLHPLRVLPWLHTFSGMLQAFPSFLSCCCRSWQSLTPRPWMLLPHHTTLILLLCPPPPSESFSFFLTHLSFKKKKTLVNSSCH